MMTNLLEAHEAEDLRAGLEGSGVEGLHAFIRALDAQYDRSILIDDLLQLLPAGDDLRVSVRSECGAETWVLMRRLAWDSAFFGKEMARLDACIRPGVLRSPRDDTSNENEALGIALENAHQAGISYVVSQVRPSDLPMLRILHANGFELIETRCHYHRPLATLAPDRHATRLATSDDVPSLASAARTMVNAFDRFHADPSIPERDADRLMERWVAASLNDGFADATVVPDEPEPEAFCTARYHREHWDGWRLKLAQPVLSAVAPRHKGWYVKIISELEHHLASIGAEHSMLTTQITNNAVIRCWEKLGYQFGAGEHVFRKVLA